MKPSKKPSKKPSQHPRKTKTPSRHPNTLARPSRAPLMKPSKKPSELAMNVSFEKIGTRVNDVGLTADTKKPAETDVRAGEYTGWNYGKWDILIAGVVVTGMICLALWVGGARWW